MKLMKRLFALMLVLCALGSFAGTAFAADGVDMCRIRVYGGSQIPGLVFSKEYERGTTCNLGSELASYLGKEVKDTKYYTKSTVRESGKEESIEQLSFSTTKDEDFVLIYGIKSNSITYYVRYVDSNGNNLRNPSGPFTANSGDRVYVAYIEIAGYQPNAYNLVRTLTEDYTFQFVYTPVTTPTTTGGTGGAAVAGAGGAAVAGGNAAGGAANAAAAGANAANPVQANPANPGQANATNPGVAVAGANAVNPNAAAPAQQQNAQPEEIIDLDVPLAAPEGSAAPVAPAAPAVSAPPVVQPQTSNKTGLPTWALVGGGAVGVGLIALLYWYLLFYRKKKKYADIDDLFDGK